VFIYSIVGYIYLPHIYDPLAVPRNCSIHAATLMFSTPWSPRSRDGTPYIATACRKRARTVSPVLLLLARRAAIRREYPSINPWMTIPQRIKPKIAVSYRSHTSNMSF
jgi:hypothetical protein